MPADAEGQSPEPGTNWNQAQHAAAPPRPAPEPQPPPVSQRRPAPVVVVFGLKPERVVGGEGRIDAVPEPPSQEQTGLLVDALRSGVTAGGHVLAIVPDTFPDEGVERLEMARSLLDTDRVAVHTTALPPLAATTLASLASALGPRLPSAGMVASVLPAVEAELHVVTWLGSVSGLRNPAPTMGQHLASLAPGSAFGVSSYPEPSVHRIQAGEPSVPLPSLSRPSRLIVAARDGDAAWITHTVNQALGGLPVVQVEPTPGGPKWWGTGKLVEAVVCPADVDAFAAELLAAAQTWACRWCGELIARSPCPLCGHRGRPRRIARGQHGART